ncbi:deferrochelatase/peroxidase EfeB [Haematobacter massiliensis]|uniref:iron uptake transporter deferrochelatase/peroxidase subunit n=1 Tax=Haematobacter massiliensis TaxID=195105 RepID=UPI000553B9C6|nr:iron uptake transporter deferrochelatase/peroxidase subunit [Haematobacter massiliensis]OWJ71983.1 deferrochelatase/peroxidase EfeB [Haematobacter massiliensis]OWJ82151.1 deferrochelatase/peroxidase EfeB [Haematobacter massiliensis]
MAEFRASRRGLLTGAAALAAGLPLALRAETSNVATAPVAGMAAEADRVSPYGAHQAGIVTPRPANGMVAAFHAIAATPDDLERLFRRLTERIVFLTHGGPVPELDPKLPPADSGLLGPVIRPDATTITVSLGASLFDDREWLAPHKPRVLSRMVQFRNDALQPDLCHGDIALQICANAQDTVIHALRDIVKSLPDQLVLKWAQAGSVPVIPPKPGGTAESARNLLGFRDGSANPDSGDRGLMRRIVWANEGEPDWARGGSYQAVRIVRTLVERWDRTPLGEQERIVGRTKMTGAPLDRPDGTETDVPDYALDAEGARTALNSHIRLANPRDAGSADQLMLRRPFNYVNGVLKNGQLDQGLLFIAWQADLERAFVAVQHRLDGEPLEEYIKPVGGGYFFALPGFGDGDYLGRSLIDAI